MKRLIATIVFLVLLMVPVLADCKNYCDIYWEKLVGQCFETTVIDIEYVLCFSDSSFGPCPGGVATLEYTDIQIIDGVPYEAVVSEDFLYSADEAGVVIAGLKFILLEDFLIYVPKEVLIFNWIVEE